MKVQEATLDMDLTHSSICDESGELLLYSNGMSIHGADHRAIIDGDTISHGLLWGNNTWFNENNEVRTQGFLGSDCAGFVPAPENPNLFYLIYYNFDDFFINRTFSKLYSIVDVSGAKAEVTAKDIVLIEKTTQPSFTTCAQHANGRDWWLLQFNNDTLLTYLIDPSGINLYRESKLPFVIDPGQSAVTFDDKGERFAAYQFAERDSEDGIELLFFDFDRCKGELTNLRKHSLPSFNLGGFQGIAFSASGQYLYVNDRITCLQYDTWADDIFLTQDTVMVYDGSTFYEPSMNIMIGTFFGRMRKGPDNKIYITNIGAGSHLHTIHKPDLPASFYEPEQHSMRMPTFTSGTLPTHNTLRLGPIDGSSCDTLDIDNNPISRFRYEQDTLDFLDIDFVDLSYYEPNKWEWDFGDGNTSTERFPSHRFTEDAAYRVCLTVSNTNSADVSCDTLYLGVSSLEDAEERHISVFPNPVEDVTRFAFHDYLPRAAIVRFYDAQGNLIHQKQLDSISQIVDLSSLVGGIYVYEIVDEGVLLKSGKLFKI